MLRRSKDSVAGQLALPPCAREDLRVSLSVAERCAAMGVCVFCECMRVCRRVCACVCVCACVRACVRDPQPMLLWVVGGVRSQTPAAEPPKPCNRKP
jgi:hypothetical protein